MQHGCHFEAGCPLQAILRQRGNGEFGKQRGGHLYGEWPIENRLDIDVVNLAITRNTRDMVRETIFKIVFRARVPKEERRAQR